ncbi:MAG TPA: hypothetical protein VIC30_01875 [Orrella sp.]
MTPIPSRKGDQPDGEPQWCDNGGYQSEPAANAPEHGMNVTVIGHD